MLKERKFGGSKFKGEKKLKGRGKGFMTKKNLDPVNKRRPK